MAYMERFDEYGDIKENYEVLIGITEDFYQAVNAFDPNLKDVAAKEAADHAETRIGSYAAELGVSAVLSDSEFGKDIRSVIELTGLELMQNLEIKKRKEELEARHDIMIYVASEGDYALVRSSGTIGQMLYQIAWNSGYTAADHALTERMEAVKKLDTATLDDYWSENIEKVFQAYQTRENYNGRMDALNEKKQEWDDHLYQWQSDFLKRAGVEDADDILWLCNIQNGTEYKEGMALEYFEISQKEYEKLKEKYETDDIYVIIEEEKGSDAWNKLDDYIESKKNEAGSAYGQYIYSIIDKDDNVSGSFLAARDDLYASLNADGMCSIWLYETGDSIKYEWGRIFDDSCRFHIIMDKEGKILFQNDAEAAEDGSRSTYSDITPSGNVYKKTFLSDYEHGDYQVLEYVQTDGKSKKLLEGGYINMHKLVAETGDLMDPFYIPGQGVSNYYEYECGYADNDSTCVSGVLDLTTGELITKEEYEERTTVEKEQAQDTEAEMPELETAESVIENATMLNEDYVLYGNAIYDRSGKVAAELTEGLGVRDILSCDGKYWIVTESGWYYVLDDKFQKIAEPVEIPEEADYELTKYGLLAAGYAEDEEGSGYGYTYLYDESGTMTALSEKSKNINVQGFLLDGGKSGCINLNTKKVVLLSTPEKPVSLTLY